MATPYFDRGTPSHAFGTFNRNPHRRLQPHASASASASVNCSKLDSCQVATCAIEPRQSDRTLADKPHGKRQATHGDIPWLVTTSSICHVSKSLLGLALLAAGSITPWAGAFVLAGVSVHACAHGRTSAHRVTQHGAALTTSVASVAGQ